MTPTEFRESRKRTMNPDLNVQQALLNATLGLGEVGELQNLVKKEIYHNHNIDLRDILDEAGDVLYYLDWVLDIYGYSLEDAFALNQRKLLARYPEGFSSERSINR